MNQIRNIVRPFFQQFADSINLPASDGNRYELYVYFLVADSIRSAGIALQAHNLIEGEFRFRCSPGAPNNNFSYFSFVGTSGLNYQLRNGIEVEGHSGMEHEADILILETACATSIPSPNLSELVLAIECKFYSNPSRLKSEVRKNVGTAQDWSKSFHQSISSGRNQGCLCCGIGFTPAFVTNVPHRSRLDIQRYLDTYDLRSQFGVRPRTAAVATFRNLIATTVSQL